MMKKQWKHTEYCAVKRHNNWHFAVDYNVVSSDYIGLGLGLGFFGLAFCGLGLGLAYCGLGLEACGLVNITGRMSVAEHWDNNTAATSDFHQLTRIEGFTCVSGHKMVLCVCVCVWVSDTKNQKTNVWQMYVGNYVLRSTSGHDNSTAAI